MEVMNEVSRLLSLQQLTTIPYRTYRKGPVEKFHAILKQVLLTMCAERPNDWDKYLPALLFAVREIPQESLGFSHLNYCTDVMQGVRCKYSGNCGL